MLSAILLYYILMVMWEAMAAVAWVCAQPACCWSRRWCYPCRRGDVGTLVWAVRNAIPAAVRAISRLPTASIALDPNLANQLRMMLSPYFHPLAVTTAWSRRLRVETMLALLDHPDMTQPQVTAVLALQHASDVRDARVWERLVQLGASTTATNAQVGAHGGGAEVGRDRGLKGCRDSNQAVKG